MTLTFSKPSWWITASSYPQPYPSRRYIGSAAEPSILKLLYKVVLPTSWIGNPTQVAAG